MRVALLEVEVDAPFLEDGHLEGLHELDEGAVGVLHVGEMPVSLAHLEVAASVAYETVSQGLGRLADGLHVADVEAQVDEAGVAPVAAFVYLSRGGYVEAFGNALHQLYAGGTHHLAQRPFDGLAAGEQDAAQ